MRRGLAIVTLMAALGACSGDDTAAPTIPAPSSVLPTTTSTTTTTTLATTTAPSTTAAPSIEDQIRADFEATVRLRQECGRQPQACAIEQITVRGSEYEAFLSDLMSRRIEANLAARDVGEYRYRVDEIKVLGPTTAELVACALDTIVLFDIRDPQVPEDDVIFDESKVSAVTTWRLALEDDTWQWVSARVNSESVEQDLCGFAS